jgi:hypothetical protein
MIENQKRCDECSTTCNGSCESNTYVYLADGTAHKITPLLSILTPSIHTRAVYLERLRSILTPQINDNPLVEWLVDLDDREQTTGRKRNDLVRAAKGLYVVHVDDDDMVSHRYVERLLGACMSRKDAVTFLMEIFVNDMFECVAKFGLDRDGQDGIVRYQPILHTCPIRRSIALQVEFPDVRREEDVPWAKEIRKLIRTVEHVDEVLYRYQFRAARPIEERTAAELAEIAKRYHKFGSVGPKVDG